MTREEWLEKVADVKSIEIWKPVEGFEGIYEVSNYGRVHRLVSRNQFGSKRIPPKLLKHKTSLDYPSVRLTSLPTEKSFLVHKLVKNTFHGPNPEGMEIAHMDGNRKNVCLHNLEFVSPAENNRHRVRHGTTQHGSNNPRYKLSRSDVHTIRNLLDCGETIVTIAELFGVFRSTIANIKHRRTHKNE